MMTRARRRRLHAEPSVRSGKNSSSTSLVHSSTADPEEWRDWANLMPDLVGEISGRLLSIDVAEYLRFRAACKPWRDLTDDPRARGVLDRRFRPRNWMVLSITPDNHDVIPSPRRRLLNLATAESLGVDLPAFPSHCYLCVADGLLVLPHRFTKVIRLLDPLSNAVTEFPVMSHSNIFATLPPVKPEFFSYSVFREPRLSIPNLIDGAGFDDSTSPPTLVLCLRGALSNIVFAKPGDTHWTLVRPGEASHWPMVYSGRVPFYSILSVGGRCYFTSPEGSVYVLQLLPLPQLVEIVDQRKCMSQKLLNDAIRHRYIISFLVNQGSGKRMLMVRYLNNIEGLGCRAAYKPTELFTVGVAGMTGHMELLEVDIAGRRLVPLRRSLGAHHTLFVGDTSCVLLSTKMFPGIAPDAIYLGYLHQHNYMFGVYHLKDNKVEPRHESVRDEEDRRIASNAGPWNLDHHLVCHACRPQTYTERCMHQSQTAHTGAVIWRKHNISSMQ